jgi:membrane fusion protein, multidrug efflux system
MFFFDLVAGFGHYVCLAIYIGIIFTVGGCTSHTQPEKTKKRPIPLVYIAEAKQEDITRYLNLTGTIEPGQIAQLASAAEGPIDLLRVSEGDTVTAGEEMLLIGRNEAVIAALTAAKEDLQRELKEFERVKKLVSSGAISADKLDTAHARLKNVRAEVSLAEEANNDYKVEAPWDGVVSHIFVRDGFYVASHTRLLEMYDPLSLIVRFYVPEEASMRVMQGMKVSLKLDAHPGQEFHGIVNRIYPELDYQTRTRTVEAKIVEEVALLKGMFARLIIPLETAEKAVTVPTAALVANPDGTTAIYVVENSTANRRSVTTGIESAERIQIKHGVTHGEQVVVRGNEMLKDGAKVRVPAKAKVAK